MNTQLMQIQSRDGRGRRNWELAYFKQPEATESELVSLAKSIDPDAWKLHPMHFRRARSLEAAARVQVHQAAERAVIDAAKASRRIRISHFFTRLFR